MPVSAQERTTLGIGYQYAVPAGAFKSGFIDQGSPRGITVDLMYTINPQWRVGAGFSYQDFYQKSPRSTYRLQDGSDLSAVLSNSLQTNALMAKAMFFPRGADSSRLQPYISAGAGANMVGYSQHFGEFSNGEDVNFRIAAQGGVGVQYALGEKRRTALTLGAVYNYMPLNQFDIKNVNNIGIQAGLRFALRNDGRGGRNNGDYYQNQNRQQPNHRYRNW
jgi:opacity protein-like surface antigen